MTAMFYLYLFILILTKLICVVLTEPNLCKKPQIDSISYLTHSKMIFFTSNGWYWLVKENEMPPPRGRGKQMKSFKGEASFFRNLLQDCGDGEQEVVATQLFSDGTYVKSYDLRSSEWTAAKRVGSDSLLQPARVEWSKRVDAMFDIDKTNIVVIQGEQYATIDITGVCQNRKMFSNSHGPYNTKEDFSTDKKIDATMYKNGELFVFTGKDYFKITSLEKLPNGRYRQNGRSLSKPIAQDFFKYPAGNCPTFPDEGGISTVMIILIVLFIVIVIIVAAVVFIAYRRKQRSNQLAAKKSVKGVKGAAKPVFNPNKGKQLPKPPKDANAQTTPTDSKNKAQLTERSTRS